MDPAPAIEEPALHGVGLSLDQVSDLPRLRAELAELRQTLGTRDAEIRQLRSQADLAPSRRAEGRSQQAENQESLEVLAGGVAHEFNNLLMSILGYADLARSALPPLNPAGGAIENIARAARRAAKLSHQMLAFSGRGNFVVEPLDLSCVVAAMQRQIEAVLPEGAALSLDVAQDLPPIEADAEQLRQAVLSLVTNAGEALDGGGSVAIAAGRLDCRRSDLASTYQAAEPGEGPYVYLDVVDDGCGMDEPTAAKIFEPFFSTKFTGRGLGLAATWGIVRGHAGAIRVESAVGLGTTVRLLFPAIRTGIA
ncbi:MAG: ATP-binding protein [Acidobacteriota bacterium]